MSSDRAALADALYPNFDVGLRAFHGEPKSLSWPLRKRQQVRDLVDRVGQQQRGGGGLARP